MAALGRLRVPRPPALCQRSAMLFTHERGAEASVPAANYPVLIFFGEKETRPFQTWPNLISWGRRGRVQETSPHRPRVKGLGWGGWVMASSASRLGQEGWRALCAHPGCSAIPEGAGCAGLECWKLLQGSPGRGLPRGVLSGFVRAHLCCCHRFATLPWET